MEGGTSSAPGAEQVTAEWIPVCGLVRDVLDRMGDKWSLLVWDKHGSHGGGGPSGLTAAAAHALFSNGLLKQ